MSLDDHRRRPPTQGSLSAVARAQQAMQHPPRDRMGQAIRPGALVVVDLHPQPVWEVAAVQPILDPRLPAGLAQVTLQAVVPLTVGLQQPNLNLIVIGQVSQPEGEASQGEAPAVSPNQEPSHEATSAGADTTTGGEPPPFDKPESSGAA
jgi:hypothetical protein